MMDVASLLCLLILAVLLWFWLSSIHILDIARNAAKNSCFKADVQFLDDTVAGTGISFTRDHTGRRALRRSYRFEFTETGNTRIEGQVIMLGGSVESVTMDPYQILQ